MSIQKLCAPFARRITAIAVAAVSMTGLSHAAAANPKVILLAADDVCGYCAAYNTTAMEYAKQKGIDLKLVTNKFDPATQAAQVDQAIAQKPAAILLWAIDGTALLPSMHKIKSAGIPLLLTEVLPDQKYDTLWLQYTGGNNEEEGRAAARLMVEGFKAKGLGSSGSIIELTGYVGQAQVIARDKGFREELAKLAPGIKIVGSQPGNWDQGTAATAAAGLFTKFGKDIKGVFAQEDAMAAGAVVAAERAGLDPSRLSIVGLGCEPIGVGLLKSGKLYGTILQSPMDVARYSVDSAAEMLGGKKLDKIRYVPSPSVTAKDNVDGTCKPWPTASR
ncbi:sugar ABC transporter substrate-binding protein [Paraburkholderia sabiae]|uniref:Sugar ABC transporter substrate-binding protein n=1 Tax=Paraburkholderia sabiae TaxID=273251 RepID=A0ABU9QK83_9BURK|nr:sugar ABC transporter substrate-binding protein [Paraburkholderia sabiae]WJZ76497.1 sugar ABC transporter substrate-binding protein [Paraburkholderia sabiae]CAD6560246.1 D-threitol-binding protein [Paraburkholderia sabiae]